MKVLVTGGCGFVGSNLVDHLVSLGHQVLVIDNLSAGKKEYCNDKADYIFADIKNIFNKSLHDLAISRIIKKSQATFLRNVNIVYHLAAEARIQPSFKHPLYTCYNNSYGTALMCEYARKNNCKLVYAGSSSFYGGVYLNPYAFAKWQGEEVIKMYSNVYNLKSSIARFFNVYGPRNPEIGQYTPVVAIFERQKKQNQPLTIIGDGEQRRDFTHVDDICRGLIAISEGDYLAEVFNLGTGKNFSINELAAMFGGPTKHLSPRPGESQETLADITKTTRLTGWRPTIKIEDYIRECLGENRDAK